MKPLAIDLYAGLGGWTDGLLAEGYEVVGFDIERHRYALPELPEADGAKHTKPVEKRGWTQGCAVALGLEGAGQQPRTRIAEYPAQLVLQDVTTIHGRQFKNAALIVASPPCQEFSYMAMPWKRAKQIARALRGETEVVKRGFVERVQTVEFPDGYAGSMTVSELTALFDACFRIQREASEAAGHHIPLVVENVKGAQPWVGRAQANFGSFYLWGDIAMVGQRIVPPCPQFGAPETRAYRGVAEKFNPDGTKHPQGSWFAVADSKNRGAQKIVGYSDPRRNGGLGAHLTSQSENDGRAAVKNGKDWFGSGENCSLQRRAGSHSSARKAASAQIARIPFELARYVARVYHPFSS